MNLYQLAKQTEPNDKIRWQGEEGTPDNPKQRTVQTVILEVGKVTVEAEGPRGGDARFWVTRDGESQVLFGNRGQGPIEWAANDTKGLDVGPAPNPPD